MGLVTIAGYQGFGGAWRYRATCNTCTSQWAAPASWFERIIVIGEMHLKESKRCANTWAT